MKLCTKCGDEHPAEGFYKSKATKDGLTYWCRSCYAANYAANRERHARSVKTDRLRKRYGLTIEEYDGLIASGCGVCGSHDAVGLDHCHSTGQVRAPLCRACNMALGAARDDPDRLEALARFLREGVFVGTVGYLAEPRYIGPDGDELRRLYIDQGLSIAAIARKYKTNISSVRTRVHALGVTVRPNRRPLDEAEMVRLYVEEKWSLGEVASRFSMSSGGIRKRLIACGVEMRSAGGVSHVSRLRA